MGGSSWEAVAIDGLHQAQGLVGVAPIGEVRIVRTVRKPSCGSGFSFR